jgi:hypothetical protein
MSIFGAKQTCRARPLMSAYRRKADVADAFFDVGF